MQVWQIASAARRFPSIPLLLHAIMFMTSLPIRTAIDFVFRMLLRELNQVH